MGHGVHFGLPELLANVPIGQLEHEVDPGKDVVPGGQGWHLEAPAGKNWPAAQLAVRVAGAEVREGVGALLPVRSVSISRSSESSTATG